MSIIRKIIALTEQPRCWLRYHVEISLCAPISRYIRNRILRVQESPEYIEAVRRELIKGEQSPIVPFDSEEFKKEMIKKYG